MKIRIKGNSLRLRLTQSEVNRLSEESTVSETTQFSPSDIFRYSLSIFDKQEIQADYSAEGIHIFLPLNLSEKWTKTEQVGIEHLLPTGNDVTLKILIEKDFNCLIKRTGEDDTDAYPNPLKDNRL